MRAGAGGAPASGFSEFRRASVLALALPVIFDHARRMPRPGPLEENFRSAFDHLPADSRVLLLLHEKHGIPLSELASAWSEPEDTLKIRRQQALRTLSEWVWESD